MQADSGRQKHEEKQKEATSEKETENLTEAGAFTFSLGFIKLG